MSRRAKWQAVLDDEIKRWSSMSCECLIAELQDVRTYLVEVDSKQFHSPKGRRRGIRGQLVTGEGGWNRRGNVIEIYQERA